MLTALLAVLAWGGVWGLWWWHRRRALDRALQACLDGTQGYYPREVVR